jgi:hypothetical protein
LPRKHGGPTILENLSLACFPCNRFKGPNLSGIDPESRLTALDVATGQIWQADKSGQNQRSQTLTHFSSFTP